MLIWLTTAFFLMPMQYIYYVQLEGNNELKVVVPLLDRLLILNLVFLLNMIKKVNTGMILWKGDVFEVSNSWF